MQESRPILSYASRKDDAMTSRSRHVLRFGAEQLLTAFGAILLIAFFVGMFLLFSRSVLSGIIGGLTGMLLIPLMGTFVRQRQRVGGLRVLQYLEQCTRLNLPLPDFLANASQSESTRPAAQLRAIAASVSHGVSLGDTIRSEVPELPTRFAWTLRSAEANGTLGPTLTRIIGEIETEARHDAERPSTIPINYVALLTVLALVSISFLAVFVAPKIAQISKDFGVSPLPLQRTLQFADSLLVQLILLAIFLIAAFVLLSSLVSSASAMMSRHGKQYDPARGVRERLSWYLPLLGPISRDSNLADVCQSIADALHANRPFDLAIAEAAHPHLNVVLLKRLEKWQILHGQGQSIGQAARAASMPSLVAGMLPDRADRGSCAAAFEFLAKHYRDRSMRSRLWLRSLLPTVITFVFGVIVLFVSYVLFTSVWSLIDAVAPYKVSL